MFRLSAPLRQILGKNGVTARLSSRSGLGQPTEWPPLMMIEHPDTSRTGLFDRLKKYRLYRLVVSHKLLSCFTILGPAFLGSQKLVAFIRGTPTEWEATSKALDGMMDEHIMGVLDIWNTLDRMEANVDALREELRDISRLLEEKKK